MNTKKKQQLLRPKNKPQRVDKAMQSMVDDPEFILYNILKAMKA